MAVDKAKLYKAQKALTYNKTVLYFILRIAKEMISAKNTQYAIRNTQYAIRNTQYAIRNTQYAIL